MHGSRSSYMTSLPSPTEQIPEYFNSNHIPPDLCDVIVWYLRYTFLRPQLYNITTAAAAAAI